MEELESFKQAQDLLRSILTGSIGAGITYVQSKQIIKGVIIELNKYSRMPTIKVRSSTGKEYYIYFYSIISVDKQIWK